MNLNRLTDNIKISPSGCWEWTKSCSSSGYGQFKENKKYWNAHVYSWVLHNGPLLGKEVVRHTCHNRKCCNPEHLAKGTQGDNYKDSEEAHKAAAARRRKQWTIGGINYPTCRDAVDSTGIAMNTIIKYTRNGIFDIGAYRLGCYRAAWKPKDISGTTKFHP